MTRGGLGLEVKSRFYVGWGKSIKVVNFRFLVILVKTRTIIRKKENIVYVVLVGFL